ncbi:MAG: hypothetical protein KDA78_18185, partial [Planctomycetaceae bacterium]|nr:hypothetical protein [Planctomycetaceae bacterium]
RGDASRGKTNVPPHPDLLPTAVFTSPPYAHGGEKGPGSRERSPKEDWSTRVNPSKGEPPKKHVGNLISVHEFSKPFFAEVRFREAVRKGWCVEGDRLRYHTLWEYVHRHTTDPDLKTKLHNPPAFFMDALKNKRWHGQETDERKANQHLKEIDHTLDTRKKQFA